MCHCVYQLMTAVPVASMSVHSCKHSPRLHVGLHSQLHPCSSDARPLGASSTRMQPTVMCHHTKLPAAAAASLRNALTDLPILLRASPLMPHTLRLFVFCPTVAPVLCHTFTFVTHLQEAAAAKAKAEERAALLFVKKKNTAVERKQKKEQKDEAERHIAAQEALVRHCNSSSGGSSSSRSCVCLSKPCACLIAVSCKSVLLYGRLYVVFAACST